jgi:hypothetical protein
MYYSCVYLLWLVVNLPSLSEEQMPTPDPIRYDSPSSVPYLGSFLEGEQRQSDRELAPVSLMGDTPIIHFECYRLSTLIQF